LKEKKKSRLLASSNTHIGQKELYVTSGHYAKYGQLSTYKHRMGEDFLLKPMNCPHHCKFNVRPWSYKDYKNVMLNLGLFTDTNKEVNYMVRHV
jgi:threonyl-tRNA synthetase